MERVRGWCGVRCRVEVGLAREALGELTGTALLLSLGDGCVAQSVLSGGAAGGSLSIHLGWGLAVMLGVLAAGGVSGAHLNPAISLSQWLLGNLSTGRLLLYQAAQYAGAFFGAAIVYAIYYDALNAYDGGYRTVTGPNATAGIFATYPQPFLNSFSGLADQVSPNIRVVLGLDETK